MFLTTLPDVITLTISHLFFQLSVIDIMIPLTFSNLLEFPFDYISPSLFIVKSLILGLIPLIEIEINFIYQNKDQFSFIKES